MKLSLNKSPLNSFLNKAQTHAIRKLNKFYSESLARLNHPQIRYQLLRSDLIMRDFIGEYVKRGVGESLIDKAILDIERIIQKNPGHPEPYRHLAEIQLMAGRGGMFETVNEYGRIRKQWIRENGLDRLGVEFLSTDIMVGALGNYYNVYGLIMAQKLGLRADNKPLLLLPGGQPVRNATYFEYFKPHIQLIEDNYLCDALIDLRRVLTIPLEFCVPLNDSTPHIFFINSITEHQWLEAKKPPLFQLTDAHRAVGLDTLRKMGLPDDAWYVSLHVREPGYRDGGSDNESYRNADPKTYMESIEEITASGGWVFRIGDPSMEPLPPMRNFIDYAHNEHKSELMDIFLLASSRFTIGTSSGPFAVSKAFGVPVLLTNVLPSFSIYELGPLDLFLPRICKNRETNEYFDFRALFSPPISMLTSSRTYDYYNITWVENSPDELSAATGEMLNRTSGNHEPVDNALQDKFRQVCASTMNLYGDTTAQIHASMAADFLEEHKHLI